MNESLAKITDIKATRLALQKSSNRFRAYMENSMEAIFCIELVQPLDINLGDEEQIEHLYKHGYVSEANDAWARIAGYQYGKDMIGFSFEDIMPSSMPESIATLKKAISTQYHLNNFETTEVYPNGVKIYALNNLTGIIDDGKLMRLWGTGIDITEQKLAREELIKSQRILAEAQKIAHLGSWEWDIHDDSNIWSDEQFRIFGYEPDEIEPTHDQFVKALHPDDRSKVIDAVKSALDDKKSYNIEFRIVRPDLTVRTISAQGEVYRDEQNNPIRMLGTVLDISKQKQIEDELRYNQKDLQKLAGRLILNQEEQFSQLARDLHDDLTQQLAVLAIEAGNIEKQKELPTPVVEKISDIKNRLIQVSKEVHALSRNLHPSIIEDLGLERAVKSECDNYSSRMGIEVVFNPNNVHASVPKDIALAIYRIIQEGLANIVKYAKTKHAYVFLEGIDNYISLTIRDTGVGFDPAQVRQKASLGLASMRERVRLINGELTITSKPGKGTCIEVTIPLHGDNP
jgi:PAS domain S-box-containing protein